MSNFRDKLKAARLPETVVPVVLRGDLAAEHERISKQLDEARATRSDSLAGPGTSALEEQVRAIEAEMRDSVVEFRLRALPRAKRPGEDRLSWAELKKQHPPREKGGEILIEDRIAGGVNIETLGEPLVKASVVEPDDMTDADWTDLLEALTQSQFDELVAAAWRLNEGKVDVPFWSAG